MSTRADLNKRRGDVAAMFDRVAGRYDLLNDLMTLGTVHRWRADVIDALDPTAGDRVLDLAAGTGTSSAPFAAAGAIVYPTDLSLGMLVEGKKRQPRLNFVAGDALALPFDDNSFDMVTISFGLRNVEDTVAALAEMRRVTRPGGQLVILEVSTPTSAVLKLGHGVYVRGVVPALARVSSNRAAYDYLVESTLAWPDQRGLAHLMSAAGWHAIGWRNLCGGMVAMHRGWKT